MISLIYWNTNRKASQLNFELFPSFALFAFLLLESYWVKLDVYWCVCAGVCKLTKFEIFRKSTQKTSNNYLRNYLIIWRIMLKCIFIRFMNDCCQINCSRRENRGTQIPLLRDILPRKSTKKQLNLLL